MLSNAHQDLFPLAVEADLLLVPGSAARLTAGVMAQEPSSCYFVGDSSSCCYCRLWPGRLSSRRVACGLGALCR